MKANENSENELNFIPNSISFHEVKCFVIQKDLKDTDSFLDFIDIEKSIDYITNLKFYFREAEDSPNNTANYIADVTWLHGEIHCFKFKGDTNPHIWKSFINPCVTFINNNIKKTGKGEFLKNGVKCDIN